MWSAGVPQAVSCILQSASLGRAMRHRSIDSFKEMLNRE